MVRAMPRRLPSQGPCPLARCPSRGEDAALPKVRSAALGRRLRAVLASLQCVAWGWWFSDGHVSSCSNAGESSLALELRATTLGWRWVPKRSHRAISQRAVKSGLADLPFECAMRNEIKAVWVRGVDWCRIQGADTHAGLLAPTQHPRARAGVFAGRPLQRNACTQGRNVGAKGCSCRGRGVRLPGRAPGPGREHDCVRRWGHMVACFFTCCSYMGVKRGKTLGKRQFRATRVLQKFGL